jgi:glycine hydroxymethyltransferase
MSLDSGGHLTHGSKVNLSGKWFNAFAYHVDEETGLIDLKQVRRIAHEVKPKLIIAGGSAYSRKIDFAEFANIAKEVGAYFLVDMAHFSGLVAGGVLPSPFPYADVVTSTTHKTLRGPRGGIILTNSEELAKKIDSAVFPGIQGGPLMHVIAAKAVTFFEALQPEFKQYCLNILENAQILSYGLIKRGYNIFTGGTDTHLVLVDLRSAGITGKDAQHWLGTVGITCNKNAIPFDTQKPTITSGIRLGTPAGTTRGFMKEEYALIADILADVFDALQHSNGDELDALVLADVRGRVAELCSRFPLY